MAVNYSKSIFALAIFIFQAALIHAQILPFDYTFKKETEPETGASIFVLNPNIEDIISSSRKGKSFSLLSAAVQPERGNYGLLFWNANPKYQLSTSRDKGCDLTIDGARTRYPRFIDSPNRRVVGRIRIEAAAVEIVKPTFDQLVKARKVVIRCGPVRYKLDQDNINALIYFGTEIGKDLKGRGVTAK